MSFDPALGSDRDWVRLLIGDTGTPEIITDATIDALLAEAFTRGASAAGAKYCAAATAGLTVAARWQAMGGNVAEKAVSKLRIQYITGGNSNALDAYRLYLDGLKVQCTQLSMTSPALLKAW